MANAGVIFLIAFAVLIGLFVAGFLVWYFVFRKKDSNGNGTNGNGGQTGNGGQNGNGGQTGPTGPTGPTGNGTSINSLNPQIKGGQIIVANWTPTSQFRDVKLHAAVLPFTINSQGDPSITTHVSDSYIAGTNNVAVTNISPGTYFTILVATDSNGNISSFSQDGVMVSFIVPTTIEFNIKDIPSQSGSIFVETNNEVRFRLNVDIPISDSSGARWFYDVARAPNDGKPTLALISQQISESGPTILYNNNGVLAVKQFSQFNGTEQNETASWVFIDSQKWCLASDFTKCITLASVTDDQPLTIGAGSNWANIP